MPLNRSIAVFFGAAIALAVAPAAYADGVTFGAPEPGQLQIGAGVYNVVPAHSDDPAGIFRGEYRFGTHLWLLTPLVGLEVATDGSFYGYGGFGLDIALDDHWMLMPNEAVGGWSRGDNNSINLGGTIEFRSGAELDYRFDDGQKIGVTFHHISNAGISKHNPGEEEALLAWSFPIDGGP